MPSVMDQVFDCSNDQRLEIALSSLKSLTDSKDGPSAGRTCMVSCPPQ